MKVRIISIPSAIICYEVAFTMCLMSHQQIIITFGSNIDLESRELVILSYYYGFICIMLWQNLGVNVMRFEDNGIFIVIIEVSFQFNWAAINDFWILR